MKPCPLQRGENRRYSPVVVSADSSEMRAAPHMIMSAGSRRERTERYMVRSRPIAVSLIPTVPNVLSRSEIESGQLKA